ncbi:MAG: RlmE family RNA methyltransferase [Alphaproteobacteria bacterium]
MSRNKPTSRVRTAKGRKTSSKLWLERQLNDPYIEQAKKEGYRSRAVYKLKQIDEKLKLLKPGMLVVDLGAAPGGWSQYAASRQCRVIALDILDMDEIAGVEFLKTDFMEEEAPEKLKEMLKGEQPFIVLSDMAPNTTGHKQTDHIRIMAAVETCYYFAIEVLQPGGVFIGKVLQGGAENELLGRMKKDFKTVRHIKPPASRKESSEQYVVASGFRAG